MTNEKVLKLFKQLVLEEGLPNPHVYLFGSRTRQNYSADSDWDFFVISDKKLSQEATLAFKRNIRTKFYAKYLCPIDVILRDKNAYTREKKVPNTLSYAVAREGIAI